MRKIRRFAGGMYGDIYSAEKLATQEIVVIKRNLIEDTTDFIGSLRELDILQRLEGHPYIVKLRSAKLGNPFTQGCFSPVRDTRYKDDQLHFTFERAQCNASDFIYKQPIDYTAVKLYMVQLLLAVEYMHAKGVMQRDLKPENILIFSPTCAKLCDFGMSKVYSPQGPQSPRVVTCWYRAPEIAFFDPNYTLGSDLWSLGCVFYEMVARKALFSGIDDRQDFNTPYVLALLDSTPTTPDMSKLHLPLNQFYPNPLRKSWAQRQNLSPQQIQAFGSEEYTLYLDLLEHLIDLNPKTRYTATQALDHPFFKPYQDLIAQTRTQCPPTPLPPSKVTLIPCPARQIAASYCESLYKGRQNYRWYKHRLLFYALDIFDQYLLWQKQCPTEGANWEFLTKLRFMTCLYMACKYFASIEPPIPYTHLVSDELKTPEAMKYAAEFEYHLLMQVLPTVYRETILEAADHPLSDEEVGTLLHYYVNLPATENVTTTDLWKQFVATIQK
jgi:serine/threonine protein kinase